MLLPDAVPAVVEPELAEVEPAKPEVEEPLVDVEKAVVDELDEKLPLVAVVESVPAAKWRLEFEAGPAFIQKS